MTVDLPNTISVPSTDLATLSARVGCILSILLRYFDHPAPDEDTIRSISSDYHRIAALIDASIEYTSAVSSVLDSAM